MSKKKNANKKKTTTTTKKIVAEEKEVKPVEEIKKPKKKKLRLRRWVWLVLFLICMGCLVASGIEFYMWSMDNKHTDEQIKEIEEITTVEELPEDEEKEEIINPPKNNSNYESDYWKYIKLPLINVDFTELLKKNSDTVAFLKVNGTNINYPVVQTDNNDFYLSHSFDKSNNQAGWVFSDFRNQLDNLKDNSVIYAHGRVNKTMFGSLKNIFENNWYNDTDNYIVNLATPHNSYLFQVISVYKIPTETYYITTNFGTDESFQKFIDMILSRSVYDFNVEVTPEDKILTLSTCYNATDKAVLHAKLIKRQALD